MPKNRELGKIGEYHFAALLAILILLFSAIAYKPSSLKESLYCEKTGELENSCSFSCVFLNGVEGARSRVYVIHSSWSAIHYEEVFLPANVSFEIPRRGKEYIVFASLRSETQVGYSLPERLIC